MSGQKAIPLLVLAVLGYLLFTLHEVVFPFVLAASVAYILNPFVAFLQIRGIRRERAVVVVYIAGVCLSVGMAYLGYSAALQSSVDINAELPGYIHQARAFLHRYMDWMDRVPLLARFEMGSWMRERLLHGGHDWMGALLEKIPSLFSVHIVPFLEMALLVPLLVFFFMLDGPAFMSKLLDFVPARYVEMTLNVFVEIDHAMGNYLRGILVQAFFMGLAAGIGYGLMGLNYTVYIALWVALSSMIPLLGPISAALAGALVAMFQWGTIGSLLKVILVYGMIRVVDDWILQPMILRKAVHIHPLMLVFTLLAGAYLGGFWGLLFAVPAACMLKVLGQVAWQWYQSEYSSRLPPPVEASQTPLV